MGSGSASGSDADGLSRPTTMEGIEESPEKQMPTSPGAPTMQPYPPCVKALKAKFLELEVLVAARWLDVDQARELVMMFAADVNVQIQVFQLLYPRIIDGGRANLIFDDLPVARRREAYHRIGILNLLNPQFPDRFYQLDLSV